MASLLSEGLERYVHDHTTPEGELFERLRDETRAKLEVPQMQVGRVEGQFLRTLVQISGARRVLEIGTYSGYSALALASGLPEDGELVTCDVDPVATEVARRYFAESPWGDKIRLRLGPALETLGALASAGARFDLEFLDADKEAYVDY
jgi:caffeoyl-CoA O-methyltransferase